MTTKEIEKRIGWLATECGSEDFHIKRLKEELEQREARRDALWKECSELTKKLQELDEERS